MSIKRGTMCRVRRSHIIFADIISGRHITQDVLILGATRDHFINYHLIGHEIDLLTNVKSLTFRLFTDKEGAENHCNVGNGKLALDTIDGWLTGLRRRDED